MEWIDRLNGAIDYIEAHLEEEVDYAQLAKLACCYTYHFQRMFGYLAGMPLSEYVRRRRMSRAAVALRDGAKIVDVALQYGYDSPTAFNRAFQSIHGIAPSLAKAEGTLLKSYPPIRFQITIKGAAEMEYRIEEKPAFRVVGCSIPLTNELEQNFGVVPEFWGKSAMDGTVAKLAAMMNSTTMGLLGLSVCDEQEAWRYYIAVASTMPADGFEEYQVPAATWAVFPGQGASHTIQDLQRRVISEWLPTSGYEYANLPDVECYLDPNPANAKYEVWVPVVKKQA